MSAPNPEDTREDAELALLRAAQDPRVPGLTGHAAAVALLHVLSEQGWTLTLTADTLSGQSEWVPTEDGGRFRPLTWREVADRAETEAAMGRRWRRLLMDLDRNEHGRHEGDADVGDPSGVSQGNPHLRPGEVIGYTIGGDRAPIVMPARADRHRPEAWLARPLGDA